MRGHGRSMLRRGPWSLVAAASVTVLLASLVPVPDLALGGAPGGGGAGPFPTWVSPTTPFHLVGYAVIAALAARAAQVSPPTERLRPADADGRTVDGHALGRRTVDEPIGGATGIAVAVATGIAVAVAVGFGAELAQSTIPWRSFAWTDAAVNALGAVVGAGAYAIRQTLSAAPR